MSGLVNADHYTVHEGRINRKISAKQLAVYPNPAGGTSVRELPRDQQNNPVLSDKQVFDLERTGRKIEAHFGQPQDIEWCFADGKCYIVQSRPITTLFPVPEANDGKDHVYVSVGHQQMMTDPMKPLGLSLWQMRAARPMFKAAGRLFVDVIGNLATPAGRDALLDAMGQHDPLIKDALMTIISRKDFIPSLPDDGETPAPVKSSKGMPAADILSQSGNAREIVNELIRQNEASVAALQRDIQSHSGTALFSFIQQDIEQSKKVTFDARHMGAILAALNAAAWINENMREWLGEKSVADVLSQSVPHNVTSEMGLAMLDLADVIRPWPEVVGFLQNIKDDFSPDDLVHLNGGRESRNAILAWLDKYGMRCAGEIDITKPRWSEKPSILIPMLLSHVKNATPGDARRRFDQGLQEAAARKRTSSDG